ncbi:MAG: hypothetical protein RR478_00070 [Bacilli bacterium]
MNIIISNKYETLLSNLDIDVIKSINGEFSVEELVAQFSNFYYNKMIIDITAIKEYESINVIQSLSVNFDMAKVVLLLDDSEKVNSPMYLSQLVSMGIYNFTRNVDAVKFLIENPNTYKDVANYHQLNGIEPVALNEYAVDTNKGFIGQRVIGFKNVTEHAGSTTLVYLLKKHLEKIYKVKTVEVDSNDFVFFNDQSLESISNNGLQNYISSNSKAEVILIDLNNDIDNCCSEVIYLIEPGLIKLNKLIRKDNKVFEKLRGKKIVLNRSVLSNKDVEDFEKESGSKVFYNLPYLDDKLDNQIVINEFLGSLGFSRIDNDGSKGIFSVFK